jgi:hypothetical protein
MVEPRQVRHKERESTPSATRPAEPVRRDTNVAAAPQRRVADSALKAEDVLVRQRTRNIDIPVERIGVASVVNQQLSREAPNVERRHAASPSEAPLQPTGSQVSNLATPRSLSADLTGERASGLRSRTFGSVMPERTTSDLSRLGGRTASQNLDGTRDVLWGALATAPPAGAEPRSRNRLPTSLSLSRELTIEQAAERTTVPKVPAQSRSVAFATEGDTPPTMAIAAGRALQDDLVLALENASEHSFVGVARRSPNVIATRLVLPVSGATRDSKTLSEFVIDALRNCPERIGE